MSYAQKAKENKVKAKRTLRLQPCSDKLKGTYKDYALLNEGNEIMIIPIMIRHMSARLWRHMFWLGVDEIIINGQNYESMCSMCMNAIPCLQKGRGREAKFECRARKEVLIPLQRKAADSGAA